MGGRMTDEDAIAALRDVDENRGRMEAPGSDSEILARWKELHQRGWVQIRRGRKVITEAGRRALAKESRDD